MAERFVDAYYIEFNHEKAKALSVGPALHRIEKEQALVVTARKQLAVEPNKARVYYESPKRRDLDKTRAHFQFDLDIRRGGGQHDQAVSVMVALRDGQWKVLGFRELGVGGPGQAESEVVGTSTSP